MKCTFIEYPKCSTCKNAKKYLQDLGVECESRDIVNNTPSAEELKKIIDRSGEDIKKFFNTSGMLYKSMELKDKLPTMTYDEKIELLASSGMLIKRPLIIFDNNIVIGFKKDKIDSIVK